MNTINKLWVSKPKTTALCAGFATWGLSIFFYFSWVMMIPVNRYRWDAFLALCENPLRRDIAYPILYYRITVPLIAYLLNLPPVLAFSIQYAAIIFALSIVFYYMAKRLDATTALLFCAALACSAFTQWGNMYPGIPDSVSLMLAAICLLRVRSVVYLPLITLGSLNDERMLFALPFIVLLKHPDVFNSRRAFNKAFIDALWMAGGVVFWVALRVMLQTGVIGPGIETPQVYEEFSETIVDFTPYAQTWFTWAWNVYMGFRGLWIIPVMAALLSTSLMRYRTLYFLLWSAIIASTIIVADVSRSLGFAFTGIICGVIMISKVISVSSLRKLLLGIATFQIVTPTGFYIGETILWLAPPLYKILREGGVF